MTNGANGRKANGQFGKGNPGGPGHPTLWRARDYHDGYTAELSIAEIRKLARRVYEKAMSDDDDALAAAKDIFDRVLGKPKEMHFEGDTHNHYPVLVTTTAEAMKRLEETRGMDDDPHRGRKRLQDRTEGE